MCVTLFFGWLIHPCAPKEQTQENNACHISVCSLHAFVHDV